MQVAMQSRPRAGLRGTSCVKTQAKEVRLTCSLRPRLHSRASVAARSHSAFKDEFFERSDELAALDSRFDNKPYDILLLSGPWGSGKTAS